MDEVKAKKRCCFLFKVDFEKAYDMLDWNFLYAGELGFRFGLEEVDEGMLKKCFNFYFT